MQILVIDDESGVGPAVWEGLEVEGNDVALASTEEEGFFPDNSRACDLAVLDVIQPRCEGSEGAL